MQRVFFSYRLAIRYNKNPIPGPWSKGVSYSVPGGGWHDSVNQPGMASTLKRRPGTTGKAAMPKNISPMLATLVDTPPQGDDWKFEIKWDGYRALAYLDGSCV